MRTRPIRSPASKRTPRKDSPLFGGENASGTPSQLISRRPDPNEPGTLGLSVPSAARKALTVGVMAAGSLPDAEKTMGPPTAGAAPARATARGSRSLPTGDHEM